MSVRKSDDDIELRVRQILDMNAYKGATARGASDLLARREKNFGAASVLFYEDPIEMVSGRGAWMEAADGTQYLDFYNNVPSVGHCHPKVVEAITAQVAKLNTNTRYLVRGVETYLERLKATLPKSLSNISLACSGSEANDLAMRVAMKATGAAGFVVTEAAYHGNTHLVIQASPSSFKQGKPPEFIRTIPAPDAAHYGAEIGAGFARALRAEIAWLEENGYGFAGFICDSIFSSDGVFADPAGFLADAVKETRRAGGIYIADEVQPGFGRTGAALWGFQRHGVAPDIVTMGKPMGNGFPMSGMAVRPDLLAAFCEDFGYFNTFGGNPVAAAAGLAVLDVIEEEGLIANAAEVGARLKDRLEAIDDPRITAVRGAGLFIGVDLSEPGAESVDEPRPDPALATRLINGLKGRQVLIGAAGKYGHTLKIRPPLCLTLEEADLFADRMEETLATI